MAYIENPFSVNDYALCINDDFPIVADTVDKSKVGQYPVIHPKKGEVYIVDEILGEFLRFDVLDSDNGNDPNYGFNWWKHTQFRPITEEEESTYHEEYAKSVNEWFKLTIS